MTPRIVLSTRGILVGSVRWDLWRFRGPRPCRFGHLDQRSCSVCEPGAVESRPSGVQLAGEARIKHAPDLRRVVDAMLYISHTGCQRRFLPE